MPARKQEFNHSITGGPIDLGFDYYFGDDVPIFPPYTFDNGSPAIDGTNFSRPLGSVFTNIKMSRFPTD